MLAVLSDLERQTKRQSKTQIKVDRLKSASCESNFGGD